MCFSSYLFLCMICFGVTWTHKIQVKASTTTIIFRFLWCFILLTDCRLAAREFAHFIQGILAFLIPFLQSYKDSQKKIKYFWLPYVFPHYLFSLANYIFFSTNIQHEWRTRTQIFSKLIGITGGKQELSTRVLSSLKWPNSELSPSTANFSCLNLCKGPGFRFKLTFAITILKAS